MIDKINERREAIDKKKPQGQKKTNKKATAETIYPHKEKH